MFSFFQSCLRFHCRLLLLLILSLSSAAFSVVWILAFHIFLAMKSREAKQIGGGKEIYVMVDRTKRGL
jgi:hypothetical protein